MFGRRRRPREPSRRRLDVTAWIVPDDYEERRARDVAAIRAIVDEAVIRQDAAEQLLHDIRDRLPLAELAPRGGVLMSRFVALRRALPDVADPGLAPYVAVIGEVLDHHVLLLSSALDFLAVESIRSERIAEQLDRLEGLGAPSARLDAVRSHLVALER